MAVVVPASIVADSNDVPQISAASTVFSCQGATKPMTMESQQLCCAQELSVSPLSRTEPLPDAVMSPSRGSGTPSSLRWQAIFTAALESHREHEHRIVDAVAKHKARSPEKAAAAPLPSWDQAAISVKPLNLMRDAMESRNNSSKTSRLSLLRQENNHWHAAAIAPLHAQLGTSEQPAHPDMPSFSWTRSWSS